MTREIRSKLKIFALGDRLLGQNFEAVLAVIVKLAEDLVFAKFCRDA